VLDVIGQSYHWSLMQVEYSTELAVNAEHVATFLGRKITPQLAQEIGSRFATRIEGTCIKHRFGKSAIKMYDKFTLVLRLETTTNDVSSFKHHRKVEHHKGPATRELAPVKKTIYSLPDLREILLGCNRRYLTFLSALDDFSAGARALDRLTTPRLVAGKTVKGINFFHPIEQRLLRALQRPTFNIAGIRRAHLLPVLDKLSPATVSRKLTRLRTLGLIKRISGTYRLLSHPSRAQPRRRGLPPYRAGHHPSSHMTNLLTLAHESVHKRLNRSSW
jgi:hypothetical protein